MNCIFCKIIAGEIPSTILGANDEAIAIADLNPMAPTHVLVMPRTHAANFAAYLRERPEGLGALFALAAEIGERCGDGYRFVVNTGSDGGQTVEHLHVHVLGGRAMQWPPG
ncbi:MAG: HIT domain-containing protein [Candidatus Eremiobacteraeota bacterium]|nr:HIT domain-containing protein [Candidatus Eremiobacteraeota bacterium]NNM93107.1 HIT domain-containing protein [Candidatus Eremiobacteraeota bacterium]